MIMKAPTIVRRISKTTPVTEPAFEQTAEAGFDVVKFRKGIRNPKEIVISSMAELRRFLRMRDFKGLVACQARLPGRAAGQSAHVVVKKTSTELVADNGSLIAVAHSFFG